MDLAIVVMFMAAPLMSGLKLLKAPSPYHPRTPMTVTVYVCRTRKEESRSRESWTQAQETQFVVMLLGNEDAGR